MKSSCLELNNQIAKQVNISNNHKNRHTPRLIDVAHLYSKIVSYIRKQNLGFLSISDASKRTVYFDKNDDNIYCQKEHSSVYYRRPHIIMLPCSPPRSPEVLEASDNRLYMESFLSWKGMKLRMAHDR